MQPHRIELFFFKCSLFKFKSNRSLKRSQSNKAAEISINNMKIYRDLAKLLFLK